MSVEVALVEETGSEIVRLPMPDHLDPIRTSRSLPAAVRSYFLALYNTKPAERAWLKSTGKYDSPCDNRMFDRHYFVLAIKALAKEAKDIMTMEASDGQIWAICSGEMRNYGLGLRLRREQYRLLTHQQQAAE